MKKNIKVILLATILFILSGCMSTPSTPNNYYTLQYVNTSKPAAQKYKEILKIDFPHAPSNLMGKRIIYAANPYESAYYIKNRWAEPLPAMLQDWIIQSIEDAGLYKAVVRSSSRVATDLILESDIVSFEHRLETKSVVVSIRLNLIKNDNNKIVKSKLFSYEESVENADASSAVKAFNEALKLFKKDVVLWLENNQ
jgi:ABC-type uncharacterized transport system auxiliary subunit